MNYVSWLYIQFSLGNRVPTFLGKSCQLCLSSVHFVVALLYFTFGIGGLFYEAICFMSYLVLFCSCVLSHFSIAITSLGEERANLSAFHTFVRFALVWFCLFPLPLGVWEGLRFVIMALPGLFSYLFFFFFFFFFFMMWIWLYQFLSSLIYFTTRIKHSDIWK